MCGLRLDLDNSLVSAGAVVVGQYLEHLNNMVVLAFIIILFKAVVQSLNRNEESPFYQYVHYLSRTDTLCSDYIL